MCLEKGTELKKDLEHQDLEGDGRAESGGKEAQAGPSHSPHWRVQPGKGQALIPGNRGQNKRKQPQVVLLEVWIGY